MSIMTKIAQYCCEDNCETENAELYYCTVCRILFCQLHWSKFLLHRDPDHPGPDGMLHEKVESGVYEQIERCMAPPKDEEDQNRQHEEDGETEWFGFDRNGGSPVLAEYRRYAALMLDTNRTTGTEVDRGTRHPALVSFIGLTGMLITQTFLSHVIDFH
jgi:hypothetical protein